MAEKAGDSDALEVTWPDGFKWRPPNQSYSELSEKAARGSNVVADDTDEQGRRCKVQIVTKKTEEWMVLWKTEGGKLSQIIQLKGYKDRNLALVFMKQALNDWCRGVADKAKLEETKKAWLKTNHKDAVDAAAKDPSAIKSAWHHLSWTSVGLALERHWNSLEFIGNGIPTMVKRCPLVSQNC
eukprot:1641116-Pyramimonas_sp.AAC.1